MKNFEIATRMKFRFPYKGLISVEDLWDLPMTALDDIYKTLNKDVKKAEEESLLNAKDTTDAELLAKIDIVKHIFAVKQKEAEDRKAAVANAEKRQRILEIIARKQDESLNNMSEEELVKMLGELGN